MRRIVSIAPIELSRSNGSGNPPNLENFGPTSADIIRFIAIKYRINREYARAIYYDIFKYIGAEVMNNNEAVLVRGFGRFEKRHHNGPNGMGEYLVVRRKHMQYHGGLMTQRDDPEDMGPRPGKEFAVVKETKQMVVPADMVEWVDEDDVEADNENFNDWDDNA
jgi:nucleoid DNA-binding protein